MFSIGFIELLMIAVVALLVVGPDKLPGVVRETAGWVRRFRRYASTLKHELEDQLVEIEGDSVIADLREGRRLLEQAKRDIDKDVGGSTNRETSKSAVEQKA